MRLELEKHPSFAGVKGPVLAVVMDGVGCGRRDDTDAVWTARTPTLDWLARESTYTTLRAHGTAVGLPSDDDMGNSEVGHNALGAGRVFDQGAKRVNKAVADGSLFEGEVWQELTERVRERGSTMHFLGLLSDGNVHSHIDHLVALIKRCDTENIERVRVHILLDGRDVEETSGLKYVDALEELLSGIGRKQGRDYRIGSGGGRMKVTMDRYQADWDMVQRGYMAHVHGEARGFPSAREAIQTFRDETPGLSDQNLPAFVVVDDGKPVGKVQDGDSFVLFNFRGDRAIEISLAMEQEEFDTFDRQGHPDVLFAGMMQYDGDLLVPKRFLVPPPSIDRTVGEYLARAGVSQYAISETQKFGHVTYFWNGNRSGRFDERLEKYVEIPSDRLPFEERPWMKAAEITDTLIEALVSGSYKHLRVNYANGDMVGHTGFFESAVLGVEAVDLSLGRLIPVIRKLEGALVVTADHGNADEMYQLDKSGRPRHDDAGKPMVKTSHTLNPVPLYVYTPGARLPAAQVASPGLANIAATLLTLLGYAAPEGYEPSLLAP